MARGQGMCVTYIPITRGGQPLLNGKAMKVCPGASKSNVTLLPY